MRYLLIIALLLSSCAPMPGSTLYKGLVEPTPLEEITDYQVTIGPIETLYNCNRILWNYGQYGQILFNLGFIIGCSDLHADPETLKMDRVHIYSMFDWDFILEHEKRHGMGYKDLLY